jgi:hypothetical protein
MWYPVDEVLARGLGIHDNSLISLGIRIYALNPITRKYKRLDFFLVNAWIGVDTSS